MSCLEIYIETGLPDGEIIRDHKAITAQLRPLGVGFERWQASRPLSSESASANTTHWFEGRKPDFKCIRLHVIPDGWQANFTEKYDRQKFPGF